MIIYNPTNGDARFEPVRYRPRTCFVMTQLGTPLPREICNIRRVFEKYVRERDIKTIDAQSIVTGKDFLNKIWGMLVSVPLGVALISDELSVATMCNIFYEVGLLHALGKETLVIRTENSTVPSDLVRTEYMKYDRGFKKKINKFFHNYFERVDYYANIADSLEANPLVAIDYYKRAFLISGKKKYLQKIRHLFHINQFDSYSENVIAHLLRQFGIT